MSIVNRLLKAGAITPPSFLAGGVQYETMMGSIAYGVSDDASDVDVYGFCIPPKDVVFPHTAGEIVGFGRPGKRFGQYQQHHIEHDAKVYDISIYNIVKYFTLCMENNPNMIDSLFTPERCVLYVSPVGAMVRERRRIFLHRGAWHKFKGYAYSQMHKMRSKDPSGRRKEIRERYGYDVKFAYHCVRLMYEAEQILEEGDIDLQRPREHLKAIRRGEVSQDDVLDWYQSKEKGLERAHANSKLPHGPRRDEIKALLLECLEHWFGSLDGAYESDPAMAALVEIRNIIDRARWR